MKGARAYLVVVAAVLCLVVAAPYSEAYVWTGNTYYTIYYDDSSQYTYITRVSPYLNEAFHSAHRVLGYRGYTGPISIYFQYSSQGWTGKNDLGTNTLYLNTRIISTYTDRGIGSVVAQETSRILFGNWTKGISWAKNLWNYYKFLTESLACYTASMAYAYGAQYPVEYVKSQLQSYAAKTGRILSWYDTGEIYSNSDKYSSDLLNQIWWQFHAQGYWLTSGLTTSPYVVNLVNYLRYFASFPGQYLQSSTYATAEKYFETAFKISYSYRANAGWIYGGYGNTNYLYGKWYWVWYE